ncbi:MAG: hypothetical protein L6413_06675, partial [Coriobacteriia bacterium]|nr:hypothetical protein [Coriobacteriia bacterium]
VHNGSGGLADGNDAAHHTDPSMTTKVDGTTYDTGGSNTCASCHSGTLATAHATPLTGWANTCTGCHNSTLATNVAPNQVKTGWTTDDCGDCHVAGASAVKIPNLHSVYGAATHTATAGTGCTLGACHGGTTDVRAIHNRTFKNAGATGQGCAAAGSDAKGSNPACHAVNKAMNTIGTMSCGTTTGPQTTKCHVLYTSSNHVPSHDMYDVASTAGQLGAASYSYHGTGYTPETSWGCGGCHYTDLVKEHGTAASGGAGHTMDNGGSGCGVCHTNQGGTVGLNADDPAVILAITDGVPATGDMRCIACHSAAADSSSGIRKPHTQTTNGAVSTGSLVLSSGDLLDEFKRTDTNLSGHNAMGGMNVYKASPSGIPWTAVGFTGTNPRTSAAWTTTSMLLCSDCHRYDASDPRVGPQNAPNATFVILTSATTTTTARAWAAGSAPYNVGPTGSGTARGLCGNCHTDTYADHGGSSQHSPCINCHTAVPHTSPRPRLTIRNTATAPTDVAPYKTSTGGLNVKSGAAPTKTGCWNTGCARHSNNASYW